MPRMRWAPSAQAAAAAGQPIAAPAAAAHQHQPHHDGEEETSDVEMMEGSTPSSHLPPPSATTAKMLSIMGALSASSGASHLADRTTLYHALFASLKSPTDGQQHEDASSTAGSTETGREGQESASDIEHALRVLPRFYEQVVKDIECRERFRDEIERLDRAQATEAAAAKAAESVTAADVATVAVATTAARGAQSFDVDDENDDSNSICSIKSAVVAAPLAPSPPAGRAMSPSSSRATTPTSRIATHDRDAMLLARAAVRALGFFTHHPTFSGHFPLLDGESNGVVVLTRVLATTNDQRLACIICWLLAEQCLPSAEIARHVDGLIDAFVTALERCQAAQLSNSGSSGGPKAVSLVAPLQQEILHALGKLAKQVPAALRARCRSSSRGALTWLRKLVLTPYLTPTYYFAATAQQGAEKANEPPGPDLRILALRLLDLCIGPVSGLANGSSTIADPCFADDFILRDVVANPRVAEFCSASQKAVQEGGWVQAVATTVKTRANLLDAAYARAKKDQKTPSLPATTGSAQPAASSASSAATRDYEAKVFALYEDALALLNAYLNCMGKLATVMAPPTTTASAASPSQGATGGSAPASAPSTTFTPVAAPSSSTAAINAFLSFYQPLFNHPVASVRSLVFARAWKNVCRVLNVEERPAPPPVAGDSQQGSQSKRPAHLGLTKKSMLPLSMKPFLHQLAKERTPVVVATVLKTWIEVAGENFLTSPPRPSPPSLHAPLIPPAFISHRIQQRLVYDECIGKVLGLLVSPKLASDAACDSLMRSHMYDEVLDGLKWIAPVVTLNGTPTSTHGDLTNGTGISATHTTGASAMTGVSTAASSASGTTDGAFGTANTLPALSWLPQLVQALVSQASSSPSRSAFLRSLSQLVARCLGRVTSDAEKITWMALYQHLLETAVSSKLRSLEQGGHEQATPPLVPHLSPAISIAVSARAASSSPSVEPASLLHSLFLAWQVSSAALPAMLTVPPHPAVAMSSSTSKAPASSAPALLSERASARLHASLVMQFNTLKAWLNVRREVETTGLNAWFTEDGLMLVPGSVAKQAADAGYNATPTPCSAPSAATSASTVPPVLVCLLARWISICGPLVSATGVRAMAPVAQEKLREVFIDGVYTLLSHHLVGVSSSCILSAANGTCRFVVEQLVRVARSHPALANGLWLVWTLLVKTQTILTDALLPVSTVDAATPPPTHPPPSSLGSGSLDTSLPPPSSGKAGAGSPSRGSGRSDKRSLAKFAQNLADLILPPDDSAMELLMMDTPGCTPQTSRRGASPSESKEGVAELLVDLMVFGIDLRAATSSVPTKGVEWSATFTTLTTRLIQAALSSSNAPHHHDQPDVMALLLQALLEHQQAPLPASGAEEGQTLFVRVVTSLVNELHPASASAVRLSSAASSAATNWKQWKSHPDALVQKLVCGALDQAIKIGSEGSGLPAFLLTLLTALSQLFARLPHSASCIDAVAWFMRLLSGLHGVLGELGAPIDGPSSSATLPVVVAAIEAWSQACTAFRKNFHGELDFQLLHTVVGKVAIAAAPQSTSAPSSKSLLFIDVLEASLRHRLPQVRSTVVHYWTHSFASKRTGGVGSAASMLRFGLGANAEADMRFVAACQALVEAGELKAQHAPQTGPPASPSQLHVSSLPTTPAMAAGAAAGLQAPSISPRTVQTDGDAEMEDVALGETVGEEADADQMDLAGMLNDAAPKPAIAPQQPESSLASRTSTASPHTPLCTAHSFLPANRFSKKRTSLLDRLASIPAHAFPPEAPIIAPTAALTPTATKERARMTSTADQVHSSTLSPFPATPGGTLVPATISASVAVPDSASIPAAVATQRAMSAVLAPRALADEFDAAAVAVVPAVVEPESIPASDEPPPLPPSVSSEEPQPMDTSADQPAGACASALVEAIAPAAAPVIVADPAAEQAGDQVDSPIAASLPSPPISPLPTPAAVDAPAASAAIASQAAQDDVAQSLSLPIGSISQPQPQATEVESEHQDQPPIDEGAVIAAAAAEVAPDLPAEAEAAPSAEAAEPIVEMPIVTVSLPPAPLHHAPPLQTKSQPLSSASLAIPLDLASKAHSQPPSSSVPSANAESPAVEFLMLPLAPSQQVATDSEAQPPSSTEGSQAEAAHDELVMPAPAPAPASTAAELAALIVTDPIVELVLPPSGPIATETTVATEVLVQDVLMEDAAAEAVIMPLAAAAPASPVIAPVEPEHPSPVIMPMPTPAAPTIAPITSAETSPSSLPPRSRKRALDAPTAAVAAAAQAPKRVMFCETRNVEISPSPIFTNTASLEPSSGPMHQPVHEDPPSQPQPLPPFTFSPLTQGEMSKTNAPEDEGERKEQPAEGDTMTDEHQVRKQQRASQLHAYNAKKAALKLQANPPGSGGSTGGAPRARSSTPPSILKSPQKLYATSKRAREGDAEGEDEEAAAAAGSSVICAHLASSLSPLGDLLAHLPLVLGKAFNELFASHHWVTVGDLASSSPSTAATNVPIALRLHIAQQAHVGAEQLSVVQMLRRALDMLEANQAEQKKRKHGGDAAAGGASTTEDGPPTSKRAKLVGPIESLQTTEQQEVWLERMFHGTTATNSEAAPVQASAAAPDAATSAAAAGPIAGAGSASHSQSQVMFSCSDGANASPSPFIAPELTSTPAPPKPRPTLPETTPKVVHAPAAAIAPPVVLPTSAAASAPADPTSVSAPVVLASGGAVPSLPTPLVASDSPPQLAVFEAPTMHSTLAVRPIAVVPTAAASRLPPPPPLAASTTAAAVPSSFVPIHAAPAAAAPIDGHLDADMDEAEMRDVCDDELTVIEPMARQMDELRCLMRTSMATLFSPVPAAAPVTTILAAVPVAAASSAFASLHPTLVQQLNLVQLQELSSCVHTMHAALQQQLSKLRRASRPASAVGSKPTTPTRTTSARATSPALATSGGAAAARRN